MAASIKRIICKALPDIFHSKDATTGERLEACRLPWKILASAHHGQASRQSVDVWWRSLALEGKEIGNGHPQSLSNLV
jgi:hypothetical protein